jgi:hypothetical protein
VVAKRPPAADGAARVRRDPALLARLLTRPPAA